MKETIMQWQREDWRKSSEWIDENGDWQSEVVGDVAALRNRCIHVLYGVPVFFMISSVFFIAEGGGGYGKF
jgi:hypothetical protein